VNRLGRELLEQIRDEFGFAIASEDYRDVINAGIDICIVSSPPALHYEHAKAALEAGAHVVIEKPVTVHPQEAWDLAEIAKGKNRHMVVAFVGNFSPMAKRAKRLMENGSVGEIEHVMMYLASPMRELLLDTGYPGRPRVLADRRTWNDPALSGGGFGQAQLTHLLALGLWLTDLRAKDVFAFMSAPFNARVELHDSIAVRYHNGAIGTISGGSAHFSLAQLRGKRQAEVRVIGSEGQFHIDLERELVWRYRNPEDDVRVEPQPAAAGGPPGGPGASPSGGPGGPGGPPAGAPAHPPGGPTDTLIDLALGRDVENCATIELGARTVELLDAAYRSAQSGQVETVRQEAVA
jgi:predicted dehydrogenase